ncbi:MAG: hypothetical protein LBR70_03875 [Lactobacillaceae bacterium]|jgi:electron transport complex protein RnfE|nr:hypothetical protein [Lactobacillaceae bacterium]
MRKSFFTDIIKENPVFLYLLGIVPVLGTTIFASNALIMGGLTFFVLFFSNILVNFVKEHLKPQTELFVYIMTTALFTTIAEVFIRLWSMEIHLSLGIYMPLIIVNCLILSELYATASKEGMKKTLISSLKIGVYFIFAITIVGVFREFFGNGSVFNYIIIPDSVPKMLISQTPAGGFFVLAFFCLMANSMRREKK